MRRDRFLTVLLLAAAALAVTPSAFAGDSYLLQASPSFQRVGTFWISDNPTYRGAIEALGPATSCHLVDSSPTNVVAAWRQLGLSIALVTLGGMEAGKSGCTAPDRIN